MGTGTLLLVGWIRQISFFCSDMLLSRMGLALPFLPSLPNEMYQSPFFPEDGLVNAIR